MSVLETASDLARFVDAVADRVVETLTIKSSMLTREQLAVSLQVSPRTIDRLVAEGRIPSMKICGCRRFQLDRVTQALHDELP
jgi:excisionase family DNA binding protein